MRSLTTLVDGYRRFLAGSYPAQSALYRRLAEVGQSPGIMIVACCDSRVDPAAIFDAAPGELFVVRNVANLVPPYEPLGTHAGTSAALEFAVTGLGVQHIVVMGHASCGGVRALLEGAFEAPREQAFIPKWMSIMNGARTEVLQGESSRSPEEIQQALEFAGIRHSIDNLGTFPFIGEAVEAGRLQLHGAYFGIASGELLALDPESGDFEKVI